MICHGYPTVCSNSYPHCEEDCKGISAITIVNRVLSDSEMKEWGAGEAWDEKEPTMSEEMPQTCRWCETIMGGGVDGDISQLADYGSYNLRGSYHMRCAEEVMDHPANAKKVFDERALKRAISMFLPTEGFESQAKKREWMDQYVKRVRAEYRGYLTNIYDKKHIRDHVELVVPGVANPKAPNRNKCICPMPLLHLQGCQCGGK